MVALPPPPAGVPDSIHKAAWKRVQLEAWWMARNVRIVDRYSQLVPLVLNVLQLKLAYNINVQELMGFPVRAYLLKARKIGFSTYVEARFMMRANMLPRLNNIVVAHTTDASLNVFRMAQIMEREFPDDIRRPLLRSNRREIRYKPPHDSGMDVLTAGGHEIGRSYTIHGLHASEYYFWPKASEALLALMNAIPEGPGTEAILESTANGVGGEGYDRYVSAVKRVEARPGDYEGFMPLFFSWLEVPWYRRELPKGYDLNPLDDDESFLVSMGADAQQLYWRRCIVAEKCGDDVGKFKQEYPATWQEAFQYSGRPAIPTKILGYHSETVCEPIRTVHFEWANESRTEVKAVDCDGSGFCWHIWREPRLNHDYIVGGDVAEGKLSDPGDDKSDPDYSCGVVLDRRELDYIATCKGRIDSDLFGQELLKAAIYYHKAWASPEVNNAGWSSLAAMRNYPNLYQREGNADDVVEGRELQKYGWKTTPGNRDHMIDEYLAACRPSPVTGFDGKIRIYDRRILDEELTFVIDKAGKRQHRPGEHDDMLFACFVAWQLHNACPRQYGAGNPDSTQRQIDAYPMDEERNTVPSYMHAGGIDDLSDIYEDDDDDC